MGTLKPDEASKPHPDSHQSFAADATPTDSSKVEKLRDENDDGTEADASSDTISRSSLAEARTNTVLEEQDRTELVRLATAISERSITTRHAITQNIEQITNFDDAAAFQPQSPHFDLSKWLARFIRELRDQGHPHVRPGVVYRDLGVSGSAPDLQVQQTVASWLQTPLHAGHLLGFGERASNRKILQNFDGILQGGEMLVVLGRPGSGCSTMLKTMCGELHGLRVDTGSTIHYNGIPQEKMIREFKGEVIYNQEVSPLLPLLP